MENVSKYVPKNSFCFFRHQREKQSSSYGAYRNMVDRKYTETSCPDKPFNSRMESRDNQYENRRSSYKIPADNGIINSPFLLLQFLAIHFVNSEVILSDDSDAEETDDRPRRKRKRKSRWAPENTQVDPPSVAAPPAINVAAPSSIGGVVPIIPQNQLPGEYRK